MFDKIKEYLQEVNSFDTKDKQKIEEFRIKYLGKKGILNDLFARFREVDKEDKRSYGKAVNELKQAAEQKVNELKENLLKQEDDQPQYGDLTRPGEPIAVGSRHPISIVKNQIIQIFSNIGFNVSEGAEMEDDWHNFTALNLPEHHPARDMQDTFFIQRDPKDILLRTHTSSVQVRNVIR
jgi:phenylalanyl-tRNA synthetase alpha chain